VQCVARLGKRQGGIRGLVSIWIPYDALGISRDDTVRGTYRVCVPVLTHSGYGDGGGCDSEVGEVPAKSYIFTSSDLVERGGLQGWLGEDDGAWFSIGSD